MKKTIWFWLYFIIAIILAIYFATRIIMTFMGHGTSAQVHNISISADSPDKDLTALAAASAIAPGTHTYSVDLTSLNARVAAVPGVKESAVRRMPNGNINVRVKMYRAIAQWYDGEKFFPISGDGTIVKKPTDTRNNGAVVFTGPVPNDITKITDAVQNIVSDVDHIEWIENRRWDIYTTRGIRVMLPEQDPFAAISALIVLNKNHAILSKNIHTIDMRDNARTLVK